MVVSYHVGSLQEQEVLFFFFHLKWNVNIYGDAQEWTTLLSLSSCDREYIWPMLWEEKDKGPKVGVKQKIPLNQGQGVPDSIASALSSSPAILYPSTNWLFGLVILQDPSQKALR